MVKILILYYSGSGHTVKLAHYVSEGVNSVAGATSYILNIENINDEKKTILTKADGIIFGSPTYMGGAAGKFKVFMDNLGGNFWVRQKWKDKVAAGFTVATYPSGDKLNTLIQLAIFAAQQGMIWVGQSEIGSLVKKDDLGLNESGSWLGLMATSSRDKNELITYQDAESAKIFGKRVAQTVMRLLKGANINNKGESIC